MSPHIHLAAILARDGRVLFVRTPGGHLELPGGPLLEEHEDVDLAMADYLRSFGVAADEMEEHFLQTAYLPRAEGTALLNLYAPPEWEGEIALPEGLEPEWHPLSGLHELHMDPVYRRALLTALGLVPDEAEARITAALGGAGAAPGAAPVFASRREAALDVVRTMTAGRDPEGTLDRMEAAIGELGADSTEFVLGSVWANPGLDRRTRSLVVIALLASGGRLGPLRGHIGNALNHGATPTEIVEAMRTVAAYAGFPAAVEAWAVMESVFEKRGLARPGRPS